MAEAQPCEEMIAFPVLDGHFSCAKRYELRAARKQGFVVKWNLSGKFAVPN